MATATEAPVEEPRTVSAADTAVEIAGLGHRFGGLEVLERVELAAGEREVVGLVGPSGCGKSTLLELIAGLLEPSSGTVRVGGLEQASERLARCVYMPQRDLLLPWLSALDNAALAPRFRGATRAEAREQAAPLFTRFGLGGFEAARPGELSGGMRQRVAFLRTLLAAKPVLLLDEPFAALDAISRAEMQEWLAGALAAQPATVVLVTHDVEEALYLCDRVAVLTARPGRTLITLDSPSPRTTPRVEAVTSPEFTAARERALEALAGGKR